MPIVDVEIVLRPGEEPGQSLAAALADELGAILKSRPGGTWVRLHGLRRDLYAENGGAPEGVFPVMVSILKSVMPSPDDLQAEVEDITGAVGRLCGRPSENVHVIYLPEGRGRVAFGGKIVR